MITLIYNTNIMKKQMTKVKNIRTGDIYYTSNVWKEKEIDGVVFMPVVQMENSERIQYMKKDVLQKVK